MATLTLKLAIVAVLSTAAIGTNQAPAPSAHTSSAHGSPTMASPTKASPTDQAPVSTVTDPSVYNGLGSWIDIYEKAYKHPVETVQALENHGVVTAYIETSNFSRPKDILYPTKLGQFIDAAHAHGIKVVGWYLPSFVNLAKDLRRSLAAVDFTSPLGDRMDSFGLDIESALVTKPSTRSQRLLELSREIRAAAGSSYPLGAITPNPVRLETEHWYWPRFPYPALDKIYDAFVPMNYFTFDVSGETAAKRYTARGIHLIQTGTADPTVAIHMIGGIASDMPASETRGFVDASQQGGAVGVSLYNFTATNGAEWRELGHF